MTSPNDKNPATPDLYDAWKPARDASTPPQNSSPNLLERYTAALPEIRALQEKYFLTPTSIPVVEGMYTKKIISFE